MRVLSSIQILRALAAFAVLAFHAAQRSGHQATIGAAGVDVFFVISGFIMWTVTRDGASPGRFLTRRLIRIVPLYWAVTLAMVALAAVPGALPNLQLSWRHVLLSLLFIPHAAPDGAVFPVLVPGWTLTYEIFFYAVFAGCLWLKPAWHLLAISAMLICLAAAGAAFQPRNPALEAYTDPILLEFLAGIWLGALRRPSHRIGLAMLSAGMAAFALQAGLPEMAGWRLLVWGVPAIAVVAGSLALEHRGGALAWPQRMLVALGDASYSIYLLHGLVVAACWRLLQGWPLPVFYMACLAGSAGLGAVCHHWLERSFLARQRRRVVSPNSLQPALLSWPETRPPTR